MNRLDAMATLIAAVDGGSLSAASRNLGMPLPTVSRKVAELEAHLKTQLVVRTSRRLILTEAGQSYVAACRRILDEVQEAERAATGEYRIPTGYLWITAPIMFGRLHVEPVLLNFLAANPQITARLMLSDQTINIVDEHVDVAIRIGELPDSNLVAKRLGEVKWVTCASPQFIAVHGEPKTPHDLLTQNCIMFEGRYSSAVWNFGRGKAAVSLNIKPRLAVNSADAAVAAAISGAGITRVLSYQIEAAEAEAKLQRVLHDFEPEPLPVHLVYAGQANLPLKLRTFLDFAAPRLKEALTLLTKGKRRR
ncbi:MAG: LysR family transcriptional regulator [Aestuariivirga sp.]